MGGARIIETDGGSVALLRYSDVWEHLVVDNSAFDLSELYLCSSDYKKVFAALVSGADEKVLIDNPRNDARQALMAGDPEGVIAVYSLLLLMACEKFHYKTDGKKGFANASSQMDRLRKVGIGVTGWRKTPHSDMHQGCRQAE